MSSLHEVKRKEMGHGSSAVLADLAPLFEATSCAILAEGIHWLILGV